MTTKEIGDFGEKAAEDYLVEMDYLILERNYRLKFGEIDIIAARDGGLVFVEVKTRKVIYSVSRANMLTAKAGTVKKPQWFMQMWENT